MDNHTIIGKKYEARHVYAEQCDIYVDCVCVCGTKWWKEQH